MFAVVEEVVRCLFNECHSTSLTIFSTVSLSKCMTSSSLAMLKCTAFATWLIAVLRVSTLLSYLSAFHGNSIMYDLLDVQAEDFSKGVLFGILGILGILDIFTRWKWSIGDCPYPNILLICLICLHLVDLLDVLLNDILYHHMTSQRHTGIAWKDDEFVCWRRVWISLPMYCNWTR